MKILYLISSKRTEPDGVRKKILNQVRSWRAAGHDVRLFWENAERSDSDQEIRYFKCEGKLDAPQGLLDAIETLAPDVLYWRYAQYRPHYKYLASRHPMVCEVNSDLKRERIATMRRNPRLIPACLYAIATQGIALRRCRGIVAVTDEIATSRDIARYGLPSAVCPNSIDVRSFPELMPAMNPVPNILFMGTGPYAWHGVDKIEKLAAISKGKLFFHVVGKEGQSTQNLRFHGFLSTDAYMPVIAACDVALGSMAFHRIAMEEACPLKVREYLALGLPTILPYTDVSFLENQPEWICRIDNSEENWRRCKDDIVAFARKMQGRRIPKDEVIPYIDSSVIEKRRLAFFRQILG